MKSKLLIAILLLCTLNLAGCITTSTNHKQTTNNADTQGTYLGTNVGVGFVAF